MVAFRRSISFGSLVLVALVAIADAQEPVVAPAPAAAPAAEPAVVPAPAAPPDVPARFFVSRCTGCHTIGRGNLTGPDLKTAITWREADLEIAILRMQEKAGPLAKDDIGNLIALLKDPQVHERVAAEEARIVQQFAAKLEPPNAETGGRLFRGREILANGGMACVACHRIGDVDGGTLGPDLSGVFGRMGQAGLMSALEKAPFKVMSPVYRTKPLTRQEALHLASWFQSMDGAERAEPKDPVGPAAVSVAALCMAALVVGARKTKRMGARASLVRRTRS